MSVLWGDEQKEARQPALLSNPVAFLTLMALVWALILAAAALAAGADERQGIRWNGPPLAPAEAARIMAQAPGLANAANWPAPRPAGGPEAVVIGGRPQDGPFGALAATPIRPACCDLYVNGWAIPGGRYGSVIRGSIVGHGRGAKGRR